MQDYEFLTNFANIDSFELLWNFEIDSTKCIFLTETRAICLGRITNEVIPELNGYHKKILYNSLLFQVVVVRPSGQPSFEQQPRSEYDLTKIAINRVKKLSRNHCFISFQKGKWILENIGMNPIMIDNSKILSNKTTNLSKTTKIEKDNMSIILEVNDKTA